MGRLLRHIVAILFLVAASVYARGNDRNSLVVSDTIPFRPDYPMVDVVDGNVDEIEEGVPDNNWWHLLKQGKLDISDPNVEYPRFLKFCVDVYNWGDRTFNSYDSTYVVGTGRRWKARIVSDNWVDAYSMNFDRKMPIELLSDIYCNAGAYVQYMAVSVGYSIDLSNVIGNKPAYHKKLEFGFNCARFNVEAHYWENTGGSYIRKFGDYRNGDYFKMSFPNLTLRSFGVNGYFFFNNRKYSQGAAYNFSKFQKKSAGSFIIGASYTNLDYSIDLMGLPEQLRPFLTIDPKTYKFHYRSYCLLAGYGFNWVWNKHLLFNATALPEIGYTRSYDDSSDGAVNLLALNIRSRSSITYNNGDAFICLIGKFDGNWYKRGGTSFFSSIGNLSLSLGVRF